MSGMSAYYLYKLSNRLMLFGNKLTVTLNLVEVAILNFTLRPLPLVATRPELKLSSTSIKAAAAVAAVCNNVEIM